MKFLLDDVSVSVVVCRLDEKVDMKLNVAI